MKTIAFRPLQASVLALLALACAAPAAVRADEEIVARRTLAQCYDPAASNRPGQGTILKIKLDQLQTRTGSPILAGLGIDLIPSQASPVGFPAIFTTGGPFTRTSGDGIRTTYFFDRPGSYKYLDVDSRPIIVQSITLDRRAKTVSMDIAPGLAGHLLLARGCVFF